ncbi:uncharacterized protein LOC131946083 [Physella acuta]|uniref:uncharacterized protein LOC131946083 n=1 Tax=Physella acuta TaxID=109671 RepID=UPI0027DD9EB2|nr:uncharacterized protein LOC131946083 [Physella acuta]
MSLSRCLVVLQLMTPIIASNCNLQFDRSAFLAANPEWVSGISPFVDGAVPIENGVDSTYESCVANLSSPFNNSLAPWDPVCPVSYEQEDRGGNFFPRYRVQAKCLCTYCIERNAHSCVKARKMMRVMRATCVSGVPSYEFFNETLTVGCACDPYIPRTQQDWPPVTE